MDPGRALRVDVVVFVVVFLLRGSEFMIDCGGVESMLSTLHALRTIQCVPDGHRQRICRVKEFQFNELRSNAVVNFLLSLFSRQMDCQ